MPLSSFRGRGDSTLDARRFRLFPDLGVIVDALGSAYGVERSELVILNDSDPSRIDCRFRFSRS